LLWSHCKTNKVIEKNYKLSDILFVRDEIDKFVEEIENPSVIGFSCFVWNWAFNNEVAKIVKEKYPDCLIIYGGQHQPSVERLKHEQIKYQKVYSFFL
jgi:putative methyltransferase